MRTLEVDGYRMAYREEGRGEPLVMVHGSLADYRYWARQAHPLGAVLRVVSVSLRHYYPERWDGVGDDFTTRRHCEDVAAFIDALAAGPVHLLGHSRGGNVAFRVAQHHPGRVKSLILAEPDAELDASLSSGAPDSADSHRAPDVLGGAAALVRSGEVDAGLRMFIDAVGGPGAWDGMPERSRQVTRDNAFTLLGQAGDRRDPITREEAASIESPTLLIAGERTPRRFERILDALERALPRCRRVTIPAASHMMNVDAPDSFNAAVLYFLAEARRPR